MKKLIITCALLSAASMIATAQTVQKPQSTTAVQAGPHAMPPQMTAEQKAERRARGEEKQLGLTPEQYKSVYAADLEMMKKMDEMRASGQPSKEKYEALSKERDEKMKAILTPEQMAKFQGMMNRQHPQAPPAMTPATAPKPMENK